MGIKLIVNGYFRSGTTAMWKMLKDCNKNILLFYEPFHFKIFDNIKTEFGTNENHGLSLWEEYRSTGEGFINKLKEKYKFNNYGFSDNINDYIDYLDVFESLSQDVILQPNRLSFVFGQVIKEYDAFGIQLIRNPYDVYKSITKNMHFNLIKSAASPFIRGCRRGAAYYKTNEICDYINSNYGIKNYKLKKLIYHPFKLFFIAWIYSNFYAVKNDNIRVVAYEWLINNPNKAYDRIKDMDINFDFGFFHKPNNYSDCDWINNAKLKLLAKRLKMEDKYDFIMSRLI